jgi:carboxyl-terminal processing protease
MVGPNFSAKALAAEGKVETPPKATTYEKLKTFSEILTLLELSYVEEVNSESLIDGAITGMLRSLDPHTSYMPPESYKEMQVETSGKFGGLGIEISMRGGVLTVISPIEGTPADKAGILAGDKIIKIGDESTLEMTLADAVSRLRGEVGKPVNITIFREATKKPKELTLVREIIAVQSVKQKVYNNNVGYVRIRSFTKTTSQDLDKALTKLKERNITKLVLDLRNNPGGLLNQAVEVADRFLDKENLIVYTKGRSDDQNMRFTTHDTGLRVDYPMIILVNGGSASASEIVAGALQDLGRAIILGTTTFGKGSVQTIVPLSDGSALRMTTARYYTPSGRVIQEKGINPDITVEMPLVPEKDAESEDKDKKEETDKEKEKMRQFMREIDLKKHLKGKRSEETEGEQKPESTPATKSDIPEPTDEDMRKDPQLREAVSLLTGWDVMVGLLKSRAAQSKTN